MSKLITFIKKMLAMETVRYLIAGVLATAVNIIVFYALRLTTPLSRTTANYIAIFCAMMFAFFSNKFFVFATKNKTKIGKFIKEFFSFIAARLLSMFVEVYGMNLMCDSFRVNEFISKIFIQFIVVVLNYVLSKLFVFKKEENEDEDEAKAQKPKDKESTFGHIFAKYGIVYAAILVPAIFLLYIWISEEIGPFGGHSLTMVDSLHQYLPFFSDYYDKLTNEGSLFYTWNIGMGSNLLSIIAYYMASPLTLIVVLFDRENLYVAMSLLIGIKICLSGGAFAYYMREKCGESRLLMLSFSFAYALSNYVIGYSWNLMWMDCIMILPLIMAGFERMMTEEGHYKLYTISLFYAMFCNYYIAFMICIFLVLQFLLTNHHGVKKFLQNGVRFAVTSLIAAAMSAFLLIPAYLDLNTTASATRVWPESSFYGSFWDFVTQFFYKTEPIKSQTFDGGLNIYCGSICLLLVVAYMFHKDFKIWDKLKNLALMVILFISFNETVLNYIWHGFHDQYGIPNRFSFLLIFLMLSMSCQVVVKLTKEDLMGLMSAVAVTFGFLIIAYGKCNLSNDTLVGTEILLASYTVLLITYALTKGKVRGIVTLLIFGLCMYETVTNGLAGYESNGTVDISYYFAQEEDITEAVNYLNCESTAYRIELMNNAIVDEATYYNIKSISLFGSTVSNDLVNMMNDLGFYTGANEFLYDGANTLSNSLLGVKYLLQHSSDYNYFDVDYVTTIGSINIYENPYALSLGYMVSDDLLDYDGDDGFMFDTMNQFVELATGVSGVFTEIYPDITTYSDNCEIIQNMDYPEWYDFTTTTGENTNYQMTFTVTDEEQDIYVYANCTGVSKIRIYIDYVEVNYERLQNQSYHVGKLSAGQTVTVEYVFTSCYESGAARLIVAEFNWDNFLAAYDILSANQMNVTTMEDGYVEGTVTAAEDGLLFTSIPYDAGWTVYVDGDKWDIDTVGDAFIGVWLEEGDHTIVFKYFPPGLGVGIILAILGWVAFAIAPVNALATHASGQKPVEFVGKEQTETKQMSNEVLDMLIDVRQMIKEEEKDAKKANKKK